MTLRWTARVARSPPPGGVRRNGRSVKQTMRRTFTLLLACLVAPFTSCRSSDTAARIASERDICEAVFRYQFTHNASGQQTNAGVFFLSMTNADPDDSFMNRFAGDTPPVKKASLASSDTRTIVMDPETKANGLILQIENIRWITEEKVEVDGGYFEAGDSSSGNTYYLEKQKGRWIVIKDGMHWISRNTEPALSGYRRPAVASA